MGKILKAFKKNFVEQLIESVAEDSPTFLYVFGAKHTAWPNESSPTVENDSFQESTFDPIRELLFGKKLRQSDIAYLIRRIEWVSGTKYDAYDHREKDIFSKNFYIVTDEKKVYKCIDNNNGAASIEKPTLTQNIVFETVSDGYKWKYIFTIDNTNWSKFTTTNYIPVVANTSVANAAKASIDIIKIESGGSNYRTYAEGTVRSFPNTTVIQIDDSSNINNRFYNGCALYIYSGPGSGTLRTITNYTVNSTGKWVRVNSIMSSIVPNNSKYRIAPRCDIIGDGTGAQAVLLVNTSLRTDAINTVLVANAGTGYKNSDTITVSSGVANISIVTNNTGSIISTAISNTGTGYVSPPTLTIISNTGTGGELTALIGGYPIHKVEVINTGSGYTRAEINVVGNTSFGGYANLTAIIPPIGGHGLNPAAELGCEAFGIYTNFANTEGNTIYTETSFRTVGILKNPTTYANAMVKYTGNTFNQIFACGLATPTVFSVGEEVVGQQSKAVGTVIYSNTTILMMSGDKHFVNTEIIIGSTSGMQTNILNILNRGDIAPSSPEILYIDHIVANQRANNQTEAVKLIVKL